MYPLLPRSKYSNEAIERQSIHAKFHKEDVEVLTPIEVLLKVDTPVFHVVQSRRRERPQGQLRLAY